MNETEIKVKKMTKQIFNTLCDEKEMNISETITATVPEEKPGRKRRMREERGLWRER